MKPLLVASLLTSIASLGQGAVLFEDNFDTYADGSLAGQGGWTLLSGNGDGVSVSAGQVSIAGDSTLDVINSPSWDATTDVYLGLDLTVHSVTTSGSRDDFLTLGGNRLRSSIRDWGTDFDLINNGAQNLPVDTTTYRLIGHYVAGTSEIWWLSTSPDESITYWSGNAGGGARSALDFRANGNYNLTIDNLIVATTWAEAAAIPEPALSVLMAGLLILGLIAYQRRQR